MAATRLTLRVSPGSSRTALVGRHGDAWKLRVSAPPEGGRANDAIVRPLPDTPCSRRDVAIVAGHAARDKVAAVQGIDPDETDRRLTLAVAPGKDHQ